MEEGPGGDGTGAGAMLLPGRLGERRAIDLAWHEVRMRWFVLFAGVVLVVSLPPYIFTIIYFIIRK